MPAHPFGKFASITQFLAHDARARQDAATLAEHGRPFAEIVEHRRQQTRAVVEVAATLRERLPDDTSGADHIQFFITLTKIIQPDPTVAADLDRVLAAGDDVFVAVRVGGADGVNGPIEGLVPGVGLDIKGVWIPQAQAYAEGGEQVSVLHFTHKPIGFICVDQPAACYQ